MNRLTTVKTVLWGFLGVLATVTAARFLFGLGATTHLSDAAPWGLWIAFDVMAGVALAAGGFVLAGTVYVFGLKRYHAFVRPAVLTAFLGYAAVAVGLLYDLGLPWHILNPVRFPQPRSVLFEVAVCVILYLTVLLLEFSPTVLEHRWFRAAPFRRIHALLRKATIALVILGIVLSTLHQSSLGSLFLIAPHRLHPLWYSPIIWVLFLVSAMGLGIMMVTLESFFSSWVFGHKLRMELLGQLGKAASVILLFYVVLRLGDLAVRGVFASAFDGSPLSWLFVGELLFGAVVPGLLLALPAVRRRPAWLLASSVLTVLGIVGYRFDVCIVAFARPAGASYVPAWTEIAVSVGIVAGALLVFIFFAENLRVFEGDDEGHEDDLPRPSKTRFDPHRIVVFLPRSLAAPRRYSLAFVVGAAFATALLPVGAILGDSIEATPVSKPRLVTNATEVLKGPTGGSASATEPQDLMAIDGDRDGRLVLFPHDFHFGKLGDLRSCEGCHHLSLPFERTSSCADCHRDMYATTDLFDHSSHITDLGGTTGCARCHEDSKPAKSRYTAALCSECHTEMKAAHPLVHSSERGQLGFVPSYMDAMHGLCVRCHENKAREEPSALPPTFTRCTHCHTGFDGAELERIGPYTRPGE